MGQKKRKVRGRRAGAEGTGGRRCTAGFAAREQDDTRSGSAKRGGIQEDLAMEPVRTFQFVLFAAATSPSTFVCFAHSALANLPKPKRRLEHVRQAPRFRVAELLHATLDWKLIVLV